MHSVTSEAATNVSFPERAAAACEVRLRSSQATTFSARWSTATPPADASNPHQPDRCNPLRHRRSDDTLRPPRTTADRRTPRPRAVSQQRSATTIRAPCRAAIRGQRRQRQSDAPPHSQAKSGQLEMPTRQNQPHKHRPTTFRAVLQPIPRPRPPRRTHADGAERHRDRDPRSRRSSQRLPHAPTAAGRPVAATAPLAIAAAAIAASMSATAAIAGRFAGSRPRPLPAPRAATADRISRRGADATTDTATPGIPQQPRPASRDQPTATTANRKPQHRRGSPQPSLPSRGSRGGDGAPRRWRRKPQPPKATAATQAATAASDIRRPRTADADPPAATAQPAVADKHERTQAAAGRRGERRCLRQSLANDRPPPERAHEHSAGAAAGHSATDTPDAGAQAPGAIQPQLACRGNRGRSGGGA